MHYEAVTNPRWADPAKTAIDVTLVMPSLSSDPIHFTAMERDPAAHGREIYGRAIGGDFGPIAEYEFPQDQSHPVFVPPILPRHKFFQLLAVKGVITEDDAMSAVTVNHIPDAIVAVIDAMDQGKRFGARMYVSGTSTFEKSNEIVAAIVGGDVDAFFAEAAAL